MATSGYQWLPVVHNGHLNGSQWFPMVPSGFQLFSVVSSCFHMHVSGSSEWFPMFPSGSQWFSLVPSCYQQFVVVPVVFSSPQ